MKFRLEEVNTEKGHTRLATRVVLVRPQVSSQTLKGEKMCTNASRACSSGFDFFGVLL